MGINSMIRYVSGKCFVWHSLCYADTNHCILTKEKIMPVIKIAIPSETAEGLASKRSDHFGHSRHFTVIELENGKVRGSISLKNHDHSPGGCMQPVGLLAENGVESLLVGGIGRGPFQRLQQQGIKVFFADLKHYPDIQSTIEGFLGNKLPALHPDQLCAGSGNCHK